MKNTGKNNASDPNPPLPDLLPPAGNAKPITGGYATAVQLIAALPFLAEAVDETFLRNRAREINPRTGAPWIPKPRNNQFAINPTILGLLEWFAAKAAERDGLPASYDSMQALENSPLRVPKEFTKWALKNGASAAQLGGSRIDARPVLARAADILRLIPTGRVTGIEGFEAINTNNELGLKIREEREALQRKAKTENGSLLLTTAGTAAIFKLTALELFVENFEGRRRAAIAKLPAAINRQHKTILREAGVPPAIISRCAAIVSTERDRLLDQLRATIPDPQPETATADDKI